MSITATQNSLILTSTGVNLDRLVRETVIDTLHNEMEVDEDAMRDMVREYIPVTAWWIIAVIIGADLYMFTEDGDAPARVLAEALLESALEHVPSDEWGGYDDDRGGYNGPWDYRWSDRTGRMEPIDR